MLRHSQPIRQIFPRELRQKNQEKPGTEETFPIFALAYLPDRAHYAMRTAASRRIGRGAARYRAHQATWTGGAGSGLREIGKRRFVGQMGFVAQLDAKMGRQLAARKAGRPRKRCEDKMALGLAVS